MYSPCANWHNNCNALEIFGKPRCVKKLGSDQRTRKRSKADFRVWLTLPLSKGGTRQSGRATDISELGIGIHIAVQVEVGHLVTLEFVPPHCMRPIQLRAIIRNRNGFRYGLEFLHPTLEQKQQIARSCIGLELS